MGHDLFFLQLDADAVFLEEFQHIFFPELFGAFIQGKSFLGNSGGAEDSVVLEEDIQESYFRIGQVCGLFFGKGEHQLDGLGQLIPLDGMEYEGAHFFPADKTGKSLFLFFGGIKIHVALAFDNERGEGGQFPLTKEEGIEGIALQKKCHERFCVIDGESKHKINPPKWFGAAKLRGSLSKKT